jgi:hypothetical protein
MRKLLHTAAEDLLQVIMRRYERAGTIMTSNRPVEGWGKLLGDNAAVSALIDRLLHHAYVLKCGPKIPLTRASMAALGIVGRAHPCFVTDNRSSPSSATRNWPVLTCPPRTASFAARRLADFALQKKR